MELSKTILFIIDKNTKINYFTKTFFNSVKQKLKCKIDLKNTDLVMENTFWVGLYPGLSKEQLQYSVLKIKNFF